MANTITFKHSVNSGDMIANLCAIRHICVESGKKAVIYQQLGVEAVYYPNATHPVLDEHGKMVTMNKKQFDLLKPLVEAQSYVESFEVFTGQPVTVDIGKMRGEVHVNLPYQDIRLWPSLVWPDMCPDITIPWLEVPDTDDIRYNIETQEGRITSLHDKVIINFTDRYRNSNIHYFWLKQYEPNLVFAGTAEEHQMFCDKWKINIPYLCVDNFLELAMALKVCLFFLGNQSMCWGITDAMKARPRILEYCGWVPNCTWGIGKDSFGFLHQQNVEYYFKRLFDQTK